MANKIKKTIPLLTADKAIQGGINPMLGQPIHKIENAIFPIDGIASKRNDSTIIDTVSGRRAHSADGKHIAVGSGEIEADGPLGYHGVAPISQTVLQRSVQFAATPQTTYNTYTLWDNSYRTTHPSYDFTISNNVLACIASDGDSLQIKTYVASTNAIIYEWSISDVLIPAKIVDTGSDIVIVYYKNNAFRAHHISNQTGLQTADRIIAGLTHSEWLYVDTIAGVYSADSVPAFDACAFGAAGNYAISYCAPHGSLPTSYDSVAIALVSGTTDTQATSATFTSTRGATDSTGYLVGSISIQRAQDDAKLYTGFQVKYVSGTIETKTVIIEISPTLTESNRHEIDTTGNNSVAIGFYTGKRPIIDVYIGYDDDTLKRYAYDRGSIAEQWRMGRSMLLSRPQESNGDVAIVHCADEDTWTAAILSLDDDDNNYLKTIGFFGRVNISSRHRPLPNFESDNICIIERVSNIHLTTPVEYSAGAANDYAVDPKEAFTLLSLSDVVGATVLDDEIILNGGAAVAYNNSIGAYDFAINAHPSQVIANVTTPSGLWSTSETPAGFYRYVATFERILDDGRVQISAPSTVATDIEVPSTGGPYLVKLISDCYPSLNQDDILVTFWRTRASTVANAPGPFYRLGTVVAVAGTRFYDVVTDEMLTSKEQLYTTGGVLETDPATPSRCSMIAGNRHYIGSAEDKGLVRYSKYIKRGWLIEHSDFLQIDFGAERGYVNAIAQVGRQYVLAFFDRSILAVSGDPLDDTGRGQGYSDSIVVADGIGCSSPLHVCTLDTSAYVATNSGIYEITGNLVPQRIGDPVQHFIRDQSPVGCAVWKSERLVFFAYTDKIFIYDANKRKWSIWPIAVSSITTTTSGPAYTINNGSDYTLAQFSAAAKTTDALTVESGWMNISGLGTRGRVQKITVIGLLNSAVGDGELGISLAYDYEPVWTDSHQLPLSAVTVHDIDDHANMISSVGADRSFILELKPSRTRMTAIKIKVHDYEPVDWSLVAITAEVQTDGEAYHAGNDRSV